MIGVCPYLRKPADAFLKSFSLELASRGATAFSPSKEDGFLSPKMGRGVFACAAGAAGAAFFTKKECLACICLPECRILLPVHSYGESISTRTWK